MLGSIDLVVYPCALTRKFGEGTETGAMSGRSCGRGANIGVGLEELIATEKLSKLAIYEPLVVSVSSPSELSRATVHVSPEAGDAPDIERVTVLVPVPEMESTVIEGPPDLVTVNDGSLLHETLAS